MGCGFEFPANKQHLPIKKNGVLGVGCYSLLSRIDNYDLQF